MATQQQQERQGHGTQGNSGAPGTTGGAGAAGTGTGTTQGHGRRGEDGRHEHRTAKVVELVCSSTKSFEDAIRTGLQDAAQSTRGITGCHVENMSVSCEGGQITSYRVNLKVAFGIERTPAP